MALSPRWRFLPPVLHLVCGAWAMRASAPEAAQTGRAPQFENDEVRVLETGKSYWLPSNPPGTMHSDINAGDKPIEVMVVELKKAS